MIHELKGAPLPNDPEITPHQRFQAVYGKAVKETQPREVIATVIDRFNSFNVFRTGLYEFNAGPDRHNAALRKVGATSYRDFAEKGSRSFNALNRAVVATQPFTDTKMAFILDLALNEGSCASIQMMQEMWEPSEDGKPGKITHEQKAVLRGEISLKAEPSPLGAELLRGHLFIQPPTREIALRAAAKLFREMHIEANEVLMTDRFEEAELILLERAQMIADLPRVLRDENLVDAPLPKDAMIEIDYFALSAREAFDPNKSYLLRNPGIIEKGTLTTGPTNLDKIVQRIFPH